MSVWSTVTVDVEVDYDDFEREREAAIERGDAVDFITVPASVGVEDVLAEASVDQLRDALGRELPDYTQEQLDAIQDCFAAVTAGNLGIATALLSRVFDHAAQIQAAESGLNIFAHARAA